MADANDRSAPRPELRKPYTKPVLITHGHWLTLTQGIHSIRNDKGGGRVLQSGK